MTSCELNLPLHVACYTDEESNCKICLDLKPLLLVTFFNAREKEDSGFT